MFNYIKLLDNICHLEFYMLNLVNMTINYYFELAKILDLNYSLIEL